MDTAVCHPKVQAYTKFHHCSLYSSWEMNLNIRVEVRIDTNVDGRMSRRKTRSLYPAMLKAGITKSKQIKKVFSLVKKKTCLPDTLKGNNLHPLPPHLPTAHYLLFGEDP